MTVSDFAISLVRTLVPIIVGFVLAQAARAGLDIDESDLTNVVNAVVIGAYYSIVRFAETKVPGFGWLIGYPIQPSYTKPDA